MTWVLITALLAIIALQLVSFVRHLEVRHRLRAQVELWRECALLERELGRGVEQELAATQELLRRETVGRSSRVSKPSSDDLPN